MVSWKLFSCCRNLQPSYADNQLELQSKDSLNKRTHNPSLQLLPRSCSHKEDKVILKSAKKMAGNYSIEITKIKAVSNGDVDTVEDEEPNIPDIKEIQVQIPKESNSSEKIICEHAKKQLKSSEVATFCNRAKVKGPTHFKAQSNSIAKQSIPEIVKSVSSTKQSPKKIPISNHKPNIKKATSNKESKNIKEQQVEMETTPLMCDTHLTVDSVIVPSENSSFNFTPSVVKLDSQIQLEAQLMTSLARASQCIKETRKARQETRNMLLLDGKNALLKEVYSIRRINNYAI